MRFAFDHHWFAITLAGLTVLSFVTASAQQVLPAAAVTFEVASVKLSSPNQGRMFVSPWGSETFAVKNATLDYLFQLAFGKHSYEITGEPSWIAAETYDVEAKLPGGSRTDWRGIRGPLQSLLRERFHLETHHTQKLVSGYELVTTKSGPKLKTATGGISTANVGPGIVRAGSVSLEGLASLLSSASGRPVVDRTQIRGLYDFDLRFAAASADSNLPDLFTATQEQLGLKLQPAKIPLDTLVIDHVDRTPTAN